MYRRTILDKPIDDLGDFRSLYVCLPSRSESLELSQMLGSPVIDVAIGLTFVFMTVSLATSALTEAIASALKWRQGTLLDGIKALVNDTQFTGLAKELYNHALFNPLSSTIASDLKQLSNKPAYVDSVHFATALVGIFEKKDGVTSLAGAVDSIENPQLKDAMKSLLKKAKDDRDQFISEVGDWFDKSMDRLSGGYKRRAQLVGFLIAFGIAAALNANAITIAKTIWTTPSTRAALNIPKEPDQTGKVTARIDDLEKAELIGWRDGWATPAEWLTGLLGFLLVAGSSLLGAPFWYDTLQRVTQIAGTGPAPKKSGSS